MDATSTLYKAITDGVIDFDGAHDIHTPRALVEEILEKVPLTGSVLVLFNVEFVISLVYTYKVDPQRITFYSDHANKNTFCGRMGVKYITSLETDMKFDVVVGNPPYQQSGSKNTIYQLFYNKALEVGTVVAMITPKNMMDSLAKDNCDGIKIKKVIPTLINFNNVERHFKAASTFCFFIIDQTSNIATSEVMFTYGTVTIDPTSIILSNIDTQNKQKFVQNYFTRVSYHTSTADAGRNIEAGEDVMMFDDLKDGIPNNVKMIKKPSKRFMVNPYKPKVLFNILSSGKHSEAYLDLVGNVLPSSKHNMAYILLDTSAEAQQAFNALTSNTFKNFVKEFQERSTIWAFYRNVDFKSC